jgi:hypothetical protein
MVGSFGKEINDRVKYHYRYNIIMNIEPAVLSNQLYRLFEMAEQCHDNYANDQQLTSLLLDLCELKGFATGMVEQLTQHLEPVSHT